MSDPAPAAEPQEEAEDFHRALLDLVRLQQFRDRERASYYGLTVSGAHALEALARLGAVSLNRLAAELFVDKSTACRIVGLLEDHGWVRRVADPRDGRALQLQVTDAGRDLHAQLLDDAVWEVEAILAGFAPDARGETLRFLRRLTRVSALHAGAENASCCAPDPTEEA
ncbi:MAG TPA: MarR family transcriptional regulator, partial [Longimicrobiaceae bacterium]|nr:MarR family transcriptional regulator [Longimicrobiaceae bacterium]